MKLHKQPRIRIGISEQLDCLLTSDSMIVAFLQTQVFSRSFGPIYERRQAPFEPAKFEWMPSIQGRAMLFNRNQQQDATLCD